MEKLLTIGLLILSFGTIVSAQPQTKCFQYGALKDRHIFRFEADGGDVAGSYFIERGYETEQPETYDFNGTRNGNILSIKFPKYAKLQGQPYQINRAVLTLVKSVGAEMLKVKFYGKGKTAVYSIDLESCEPSSATLTKTARRISFAKGATSTTIATEFRNQFQREAFWLGGRKNQTISVEAIGCGISFYYPDKTEYEEGTAIDTFGLKLPQTGDYLFIISPAGEPGKCSVNFKITN